MFCSTFMLVFALGLQSLNVNGRHYIAAFFTSFAIGGGNIILFKLTPGANGVEIFAFMIGGPFGIIASIWVHPRVVRWMNSK